MTAIATIDQARAEVTAAHDRMSCRATRHRLLVLLRETYRAPDEDADMILMLDVAIDTAHFDLCGAVQAHEIALVQLRIAEREAAGPPEDEVDDLEQLRRTLAALTKANLPMFASSEAA